jgi:hypothetical protein
MYATTGLCNVCYSSGVKVTLLLLEGKTNGYTNINVKNIENKINISLVESPFQILH